MLGVLSNAIAVAIQQATIREWTLNRELQESWNDHGLSSEGSMTPYQLLFEWLNNVVHNYCQTFYSLDGDIGSEHEKMYMFQGFLSFRVLC